MKQGPQKEARKIRTRTGMAHEAHVPHCNFITLANLELKRTIYNMVRTAARNRAADMDKQLAEIDRQQAQILSAIAADRGSSPAGSHGPETSDDAVGPPPARFTLKY